MRKNKNILNLFKMAGGKRKTASMSPTITLVASTQYQSKLSSYQLAVGARSLISGGDSRCSWVCFRATGPIEEVRSAGL